ncbi:MAG: YciI family protein [Acidobacteriota bacterium]
MRIMAACLVLGLSFSARAEEPVAADKLFLVQFTVGEAWVKEKAPHEQAYFAEHSANLKRLRTEGKLLLGGRYSDKGIIIVKAASEEAVRAEIDQDPSVTKGTFTAVVYPFGPFYDGCVERKK